MKQVLIAMLFCLPFASYAGEVPTDGVYTKCVRWTTINGIAHSKYFQLNVSDTEGIKLEISMFIGSATCDGDYKELVASQDLKVIEDLSKERPVRFLKAQGVNDGLCFELILNARSASMVSGERFPVKYGMANWITLGKK